MSTLELNDPAPSRIKYRMERLWLTPVYRALIRTGIPAAVVLVVLGSYLQNPDTQVRMASSIENARLIIEERPEFAIKLMRIQGVSDLVASEVRAAVSMTFPVSSLRLDIDAVKTQIEAVEAVETVGVFLRNGVLDVEIATRQPALIWRENGQLTLLDQNGARAGVVENRSSHVELPLVVGEGAGDHSQEALEIIAAAGPLAPRLRGLQRVGERRWDMILDRSQKIQLPTKKPVQALERVVALQRARDLLARDVLVVDMRDGRRPIIRLSQAAMMELYRLRKIADGEDKKI